MIQIFWMLNGIYELQDNRIQDLFQMWVKITYIILPILVIIQQKLELLNWFACTLHLLLLNCLLTVRIRCPPHCTITSLDIKILTVTLR